MIGSRLRLFLTIVLMGAFLGVSMAEAIAMPRALTGGSASLAGMDMPDCANMKMPMPCKDPNTLCLGAVCIPMISFLAPAPSTPSAQEWTRNVYEGRLAPVLYGRTIVPALEPPIFVG